MDINVQAKWTSTATSRILVEGGIGTYLSTGTRETRSDRRFRLPSGARPPPAADNGASRASCTAGK
jgi:hypothetical protein